MTDREQALLELLAACLEYQSERAGKEVVEEIKEIRTFHLSASEIQSIHTMILNGYKGSEIARYMNVSKQTVSYHINKLRKSISINSIRELEDFHVSN